MDLLNESVSTTQFNDNEQVSKLNHKNICPLRKKQLKTRKCIRCGENNILIHRKY